MASVTTRRERAWGLPLLTKELAEQSARKRTYVIRTLYATLLFGFATFIFWVSVYREISSPFEVLGRGREMFLSVVLLQLGGIYLFMPAITCGVITSEKERNTIGLLLLTKLGPWTILLEKLLGRLVPMGTFLLLSLPLLGFSYALGGVTQLELWTGVLTLFLTVLQVGALAVTCSAFFRTTVQAFIATYVIGFLLYFGPLIVEEMWLFRPLFQSGAAIGTGLGNLIGLITFEAWNVVTSGSFAPVGDYPGMELRPEEVAAMCFLPVQLMDHWDLQPWHILPRCLPTLVSIAFFVITARVWLVRRAFAPARSRLLKIFKLLDALFHRINHNRVTKGIVLINESATLPDDEPVAWRETKKKSLGTVRYLIRIFVATEFPVLILCLLLVMTGDDRNSNYGGSEPITAMIIVTWIAVTLLISVKSATLISGERSHETLDVLLSTPVRAGDLVRQKFRGVRRLMVVLAMPLLTMIAFQAYWREATHSFWSTWRDPRSPVLYFVSATLAVVIYLPMIAWISFAIGLWVRSQARAIFGSLAVIVAWCSVPMIVGITVMELSRTAFGERHLNWLVLLSPASIIPFTEFSDLHEIMAAPWLAVVLNTVLYGAVLFLVRLLCLVNAPGLLGRAERPPVHTYYPDPVGRAV